MDNPEITPESIEFAGLHRVRFDALPWEEKVSVCWSFAWRNLLVSLGVGAVLAIVIVVVAFFAGFLLGRLVGPTVMVLFAVVAYPVALYLMYANTFRWIFNDGLGEYRLVLCVRRSDESVTLPEPPEPRTVAF